MIGEDGQDGEIICILRNSSEFLGRHDDRGGWSGQLENILMAYNIPMSQTRTIMEMQCLTCGVHHGVYKQACEGKPPRLNYAHEVSLLTACERKPSRLNA